MSAGACSEIARVWLRPRGPQDSRLIFGTCTCKTFDLQLSSKKSKAVLVLKAYRLADRSPYQKIIQETVGHTHD